MESSRLRTRLSALAALAWASACGGNVVVDGVPDGSGGAGATSAAGVGVMSASAAGVGATSSSAVGVGVTSTSAAWMTSVAVTSSSTGVGGGDARSMCVSYCERYDESCRGWPGGGCGDICDETLGAAPRCNDLLVILLECAMSDADLCDAFSGRCLERVDRYERCVRRRGCDALACSDAGANTCVCEGSCNGVEYSAQCRPTMPSGDFCYCFVDGREVGACEQVGPACGLRASCCGPIFDALD